VRTKGSQPIWIIIPVPSRRFAGRGQNRRAYELLCARDPLSTGWLPLHPGRWSRSRPVVLYGFLLYVRSPSRAMANNPEPAMTCVGETLSSFRLTFSLISALYFHLRCFHSRFLSPLSSSRPFHVRVYVHPQRMYNILHSIIDDRISSRYSRADVMAHKLFAKSYLNNK